jgi:hypothetical protein
MAAETERMPWLTIRLIFGNGNAAQGRKCIEAIARRLIHARTKHPASEWAGRGDEYGLAVIESEVRELRLAVKLEGQQRVEDETLDVLATGVRKYNREDA